jgi:hypothetical protein
MSTLNFDLLEPCDELELVKVFNAAEEDLIQKIRLAKGKAAPEGTGMTEVVVVVVAAATMIQDSAAITLM